MSKQFNVNFKMNINEIVNKIIEISSFLSKDDKNELVDNIQDFLKTLEKIDVVNKKQIEKLVSEKIDEFKKNPLYVKHESEIINIIDSLGVRRIEDEDFFEPDAYMMPLMSVISSKSTDHSASEKNGVNSNDFEEIINNLNTVNVEKDSKVLLQNIRDLPTQLLYDLISKLNKISEDILENTRDNKIKLDLLNDKFEEVSIKMEDTEFEKTQKRLNDNLKMGRRFKSKKDIRLEEIDFERRKYTNDNMRNDGTYNKLKSMLESLSLEQDKRRQTAAKLKEGPIDPVVAKKLNEVNEKLAELYGLRSYLALQISFIPRQEAISGKKNILEGKLESLKQEEIKYNAEIKTFEIKKENLEKILHKKPEINKDAVSSIRAASEPNTTTIAESLVLEQEKIDKEKARAEELARLAIIEQERIANEEKIRAEEKARLAIIEQERIANEEKARAEEKARLAIIEQERIAEEARIRIEELAQLAILDEERKANEALARIAAERIAAVEAKAKEAEAKQMRFLEREREFEFNNNVPMSMGFGEWLKIKIPVSLRDQISHIEFWFNNEKKYAWGTSPSLFDEAEQTGLNVTHLLGNTDINLNEHRASIRMVNSSGQVLQERLVSIFRDPKSNSYMLPRM